LLCPHGNRIVRDVLCDHEECGTSADLDASALSDRVAPGSLVLSDDFPARVEDVSGLFRQAFLEELLHTHLPDEAEPLAVLALGIGQTRPPRDLSHLRFGQVSDRKHRMRELKLIESR